MHYSLGVSAAVTASLSAVTAQDNPKTPIPVDDPWCSDVVVVDEK